jgi:hypothetical protein
MKKGVSFCQALLFLLGVLAGVSEAASVGEVFPARNEFVYSLGYDKIELLLPKPPDAPKSCCLDDLSRPPLCPPEPYPWPWPCDPPRPPMPKPMRPWWGDGKP